MQAKMLGGILLIVGTSIGGGMLALPASAAPGGFFYSALLLLLCWVVMTLSAFLILEVNLWLPPNSNIISMAKATLGKPGAIIAWFSYLMLLYCLLAAYISSGTDVLNNLFGLINIKLPLWLDSILFVLCFGFIVSKGIQSVDYANRGLMFIKLGAYALLVISVVPHVQVQNLQHGQALALLGSVTVMITSFGFATIVPSLRSYYHDDVKKLRLTILIGSFIPLICYILWIFVFLGVVPRQGEFSSILQTQNATTELIRSLSYYLNNPWITQFSRLFVSVCVATAFIGVSLGLSDFLADGLQIEKKGKGNFIIYAATFLPSLLIILFYPDAFIAGISYAGIFCVILVMLLPALMAWRGRYQKNLAHNASYCLPGGKPALALVVLVSIAVIALGVYEHFV